MAAGDRTRLRLFDDLAQGDAPLAPVAERGCSTRGRLMQMRARGTRVIALHVDYRCQGGS
eukprot:5603213-Pleurochrysis_carterae.AAC.1